MKIHISNAQLRNYLGWWLESWDEQFDVDPVELAEEAMNDSCSLEDYELIPSQLCEWTYDEDYAAAVIEYKLSQKIAENLLPSVYSPTELAKMRRAYFNNGQHSVKDPDDFEDLKHRFLSNHATPSRPEDDGDPIWPTKENIMMQNFMGNMGADKLMARMFKRAEGVVWDLMTGKVGIKDRDGNIATLTGKGDDAEVEINMLDQFGMEIPAFAQNTPIAQVNIGDVIFFGAKEAPGWVVEKRYGVKPVGAAPAAKTTRSRAKPAEDLTVAADDIDQTKVQFTLMKVDGQRTTWKPPKVTLLGMGDNGVMVLRSLINMLPGGQAGLNGMQGMLMPMMFMGGDSGIDLEKMLPLMLMGQMQTPVMQNADGTQVVQQNPMAQMLPMMMMMGMMKGDNNPFGKKTGGNTGGGSGFRG